MSTLIEQRDAVLKEAQALTEKVKAGDESVNAEMVEALIGQVKSLDEKIDAGRKADALIAYIDAKAEGDSSDFSGVKSLGEFASSELASKFAEVKGSKFSIKTTDFKAAGDTHVSPVGLAPAIATYDRVLVSGVRRRLTIEDLLGSEQISGNALTYFVEGSVEGDFATVAEGAKKPQLHFADPAPVTESLKKIAAFIKESDELLEDLPWFKSAIDGRLLYRLGLFTENQLLSGNGTGTNIAGLLNRSGIQTETAATVADNADALFRAITKTVNGSGLDADGIVINPTDYQALRLSKDANGQYFGGGFFAGQYGNGEVLEQPPLWGLKTVVTPAIAAGTALVGAFAQAASTISKGGVSVEATNSDSDDFTNNRITIRAERRLALAVRKPAGFVKVTFKAA